MPLEIFDDGGSMIFVEGRRLFTIAFTVRMRSEVLDVSLLAKRLGGGGHYRGRLS
ncbi:hypothetical protein [Selenomonas sp. KH1T6]|uniref:hypothetical protein n=1 Tax=Selenomonas sp. KH1T6 TaxID=3158784 RepID=UPI001587C068